MPASGLYPSGITILSNMCRRQARARDPLTAWYLTQRPQGPQEGYRLVTERLSVTPDGCSDA